MKTNQKEVYRQTKLDKGNVQGSKVLGTDNPAKKDINPLMDTIGMLKQMKCLSDFHAMAQVFQCISTKWNHNVPLLTIQLGLASNQINAYRSACDAVMSVEFGLPFSRVDIDAVYDGRYSCSRRPMLRFDPLLDKQIEFASHLDKEKEDLLKIPFAQKIILLQISVAGRWAERKVFEPNAQLQEAAKQDIDMAAAIMFSTDEYIQALYSAWTLLTVEKIIENRWADIDKIAHKLIDGKKHLTYRDVTTLTRNK